jgi:putative aldouronate transport system permease protein
VADVLDTYTYRQGLESFNFSYATAAGFFQNGIGFVLVIISNIVVKHLSSGEESLW